MRTILLIGAGRSASSLIKYLLDNSANEDWELTVGDISFDLAKEKTGNHPRARAIAFDINNEQQRQEEIKRSNIIISMLPAFMHYLVAKDCVKFKKHLVTASYVSTDISGLDAEAKKSGITLMNEIGLDPGIDHMSAMKIIDHIKTEGGELISLKSYCGGLIAPESNDNPWGYKFTWNPRNVVLAGQGTAQYIEHGAYKYIPYNRLFLQTETVTVDGYGNFDAYANRDSLSYRIPYMLENIPTLLRGTLRMPTFCKAWNAFVKLGWTDDSYKITNAEKLTYRELLEAFLPKGETSTLQKLAVFLAETTDSEIMKKLQWLGIFEDDPIQLSNASPAQILQDLLERKWKLGVEDIDMIVMQHQFEYKQNNRTEKITSSLIVKGENTIHTAMAKTVGLPVGIATKLILNKKVNLQGVLIPTAKEVYEPVLKDLEILDIKFNESKKILH